MYFDIIGSGSKGNATLIKDKDALILIDFGISLERLNEGLAEMHVSFSDIDAAFFTHDHGDHIKSIKSLSPKKMYALEKTLPSLSNIIEVNQEVQIKHLIIKAFKTSHDASNPCGYVITSQNEKLVYMTDTGVVPTESIKVMKNPDYLIIESNHDIKMLMTSKRPMDLKKRILSEHGHLCNEDSAFAALEIIGSKTKEIVLAHLSEECNTEEKALEAYRNIFNYKNIDLSNINLHCAKQWVSTIGGNKNEY